MKINGITIGSFKSLVVLVIFLLFPTSIISTTQSLHAAVVTHLSETNFDSLSFPPLFLTSNDEDANKEIQLTTIKNTDTQSVKKIPGYTFPLLSNQSLKSYPVVQKDKMFKIETSDPLNKMLTIGSVSLTPISSQQGNGIVKSYGKTIMLSPVNINNINSQEDYGFSSNLPLGDYVMNVIMKYDDKPVSGLYETRLQIIQPILTENNEKVIKKEQHDTTKNIYHIVKYAGKTNISLNNVNKNNDPLKEARDYYQKLFGHVPSEKLLKNLDAYYRRYIWNRIWKRRFTWN